MKIIVIEKDEALRNNITDFLSEYCHVCSVERMQSLYVRMLREHDVTLLWNVGGVNHRELLEMMHFVCRDFSGVSCPVVLHAAHMEPEYQYALQRLGVHVVVGHIHPELLLQRATQARVEYILTKHQNSLL